MRWSALFIKMSEHMYSEGRTSRTGSRFKIRLLAKNRSGFSIIVRALGYNNFALLFISVVAKALKYMCNNYTY